MSQEWYLMASPYDYTSGYESEAMDDFAQESFLEMLDTEIADDVELCNYDLSERTQIRAIIQNNVQDTKLKTLSRMAMAQIGTFKPGMYIYYKNRYWLIVSLVDDNKMYEKAILSICNYLITWENAQGEIIQRWANIINASQYNNGEHIYTYFIVRSDQLLVSVPDDRESLLLTSGKRFIVDKRCNLYESEFEDDHITECITKPVLTYEITRVNNTIYDYQYGGYVELMFTEDEQHENDGYYTINGNGYWLCRSSKIDNTENNNNSSDSPNEFGESKIIADSYDILNGLEPSVFIAKFYDSEGNELQTDFSWDLDCDFADKLEITYSDNAIFIFVDDRNLLNKSFNLLLIADGYETVSAKITIRAFI